MAHIMGCLDLLLGLDPLQQNFRVPPIIFVFFVIMKKNKLSKPSSLKIFHLI